MSSQADSFHGLEKTEELPIPRGEQSHTANFISPTVRHEGVEGSASVGSNIKTGVSIRHLASKRPKIGTTMATLVNATPSSVPVIPTSDCQDKNVCRSTSEAFVPAATSSILSRAKRRPKFGGQPDFVHDNDQPNTAPPQTSGAPSSSSFSLRRLGQKRPMLPAASRTQVVQQVDDTSASQAVPSPMSITNISETISASGSIPKTTRPSSNNASKASTAAACKQTAREQISRPSSLLALAKQRPSLSTNQKAVASVINAVDSTKSDCIRPCISTSITIDKSGIPAEATSTPASRLQCKRSDSGSKLDATVSLSGSSIELQQQGASATKSSFSIAARARHRPILSQPPSGHAAGDKPSDERTSTSWNTEQVQTSVEKAKGSNIDTRTQTAAAEDAAKLQPQRAAVIQNESPTSRASAQLSKHSAIIADTGPQGSGAGVHTTSFLSRMRQRPRLAEHVQSRGGIGTTSCDTSMSRQTKRTATQQQPAQLPLSQQPIQSLRQLAAKKPKLQAPLPVRDASQSVPAQSPASTPKATHQAVRRTSEASMHSQTLFMPTARTVKFIKSGTCRCSHHAPTRPPPPIAMLTIEGKNGCASREVVPADIQPSRLVSDRSLGSQGSSQKLANSSTVSTCNTIGTTNAVSAANSTSAVKTVSTANKANTDNTTDNSTSATKDSRRPASAKTQPPQSKPSRKKKTSKRRKQVKRKPAAVVEDPSLDYCSYCKKHVGHLIYDCPILTRKGKAPVKATKPIILTREERLKQVPCTFFQDGRCNKGDACEFSHDVAQKRKFDLCKYFLVDKCDKGDSCLYSHDPSLFPCRYHFTVGCARTDCPFSHAELTPATSRWLQADIESFARSKQIDTKQPAANDVARQEAIADTDLTNPNPVSDADKHIAAELLSAFQVPNLFDSDDDDEMDRSSNAYEDGIDGVLPQHRGAIRAGHSNPLANSSSFDPIQMARLLQAAQRKGRKVNNTAKDATDN
eukprot:TRINITY_DN9423_c0_g1_i1.p1 TRINITY_DN9423_c0_g1~~TRINITY_DN9423_c0_g1_i1.p1  ORF type:complete len:976 (+),score=89.00 TRINITY_DN9423_c0_g1_i1:103-3030(+)